MTEEFISPCNGPNQYIEIERNDEGRVILSIYVDDDYYSGIVDITDDPTLVAIRTEARAEIEKVHNICLDVMRGRDEAIRQREEVRSLLVDCFRMLDRMTELGGIALIGGVGGLGEFNRIYNAVKRGLNKYGW